MVGKKAKITKKWPLQFLWMHFDFVQLCPNQSISAFFFSQNEIHIYTVDNNTLVKKTSTSVSHATAVCDVAYSPDGAYLAAGDDNRRITVFNSTDYQVRHIGTACMEHCSRCCFCSPDVFMYNFFLSITEI